MKDFVWDIWSILSTFLWMVIFRWINIPMLQPAGFPRKSLGFSSFFEHSYSSEYRTWTCNLKGFFGDQWSILSSFFERSYSGEHKILIRQPERFKTFGFFCLTTVAIENKPDKQVWCWYSSRQILCVAQTWHVYRVDQKFTPSKQLQIINHWQN